mgnify:CR=1 FL=1
MDIKRQERAPIYEALEEFKKKRVVPFDVPGHKRGEILSWCICSEKSV